MMLMHHDVLHYSVERKNKNVFISERNEMFYRKEKKLIWRIICMKWTYPIYVFLFVNIQHLIISKCIYIMLARKNFWILFLILNVIFAAFLQIYTLSTMYSFSLMIVAAELRWLIWIVAHFKIHVNILFT